MTYTSANEKAAFLNPRRYDEGASDQRVYWSTSDDCGRTWRAPEALDVPNTVPGGAAQWSPVLWLEPPRRGGALRVVYSTDPPPPRLIGWNI